MHRSANEGIEGVRFAVMGGQGFVGAALCLELLRRGAPRGPIPRTPRRLPLVAAAPRRRGPPLPRSFPSPFPSRLPQFRSLRHQSQRF
uniref:3-beta hydroxysteroid dehydrogenase/isomerase domain-containing protein n=1 Tax=Arundo donax TaxID=35708 RepID=A0A0A9CLR3_ARUDO